MSTIQLPPSPPESQTGSTQDRPTWRPERSRNDVLAALLIAFGLLFLVSNVYAVGGGAFLLAIGLAFAFARITSGRYGFAVPAGILLGLGAFTMLEEANAITGREPGWSLVLLALGFVAVYVIGWRPTAIWPFFPALALGTIGLLFLGSPVLRPLAAYAWIAIYWPAVLVVLGLWILARAYLPTAIRRPFELLALTAIIVYGVVAFAASIAASAAVLTPGFDSSFGSSAPWTTAGQPTITLNAPLGASGALRIVNPTGGSTTVRGGDRSDVQASVTARSWWFPVNPPDVRLTPIGGVLTLDPGNQLWSGFPNQLDYVVDVPSTASIDLQATSGHVDVRGTSGAVTVNNSSGSVALSQLTGPVSVHASSGSIDLANISGELQVSTSSGSITGTGLGQLRSATSSSGSIDLAGTFSGDSQIHTSSGSVNVRLGPESSAQLTANSSSGGIAAPGLSLANPRVGSHSLAGVLGSGTGSLQVTTSSGQITFQPGG